MSTHTQFQSYVQGLQENIRRKGREIEEIEDAKLDIKPTPKEIDSQYLICCRNAINEFLEHSNDENEDYIIKLYEYCEYIAYLPDDDFINLHNLNFEAYLSHSINYVSDAYQTIVIITKFLIDKKINTHEYSGSNPLFTGFADSLIMKEINLILQTTKDKTTFTSIYTFLNQIILLNNTRLNEQVIRHQIIQAIIGRISVDLYTDFFPLDIQMISKICEISDQVIFQISSFLDKIIVTEVPIEHWIYIARWLLQLLQKINTVRKNRFAQVKLLKSLVTHLQSSDDPDLIFTLLQVFKYLTYSESTNTKPNIAGILLSLNFLNILREFVGQNNDDTIIIIASNLAYASEDSAMLVYNLGYVDLAKKLFEEGSVSEQVSSGYMISNMLINGTNEVVDLICNSGLIWNMLELIDTDEVGLTHAILESIYRAISRVDVPSLILTLKSEQFIEVMNQIPAHEEYIQNQSIMMYHEKILEIIR